MRFAAVSSPPQISIPERRGEASDEAVEFVGRTFERWAVTTAS